MSIGNSYSVLQVDFLCFMFYTLMLFYSTMSTALISDYAVYMCDVCFLAT